MPPEGVLVFVVAIIIQIIVVRPVVFLTEDHLVLRSAKVLGENAYDSLVELLIVDVGSGEQCDPMRTDLEFTTLEDINTSWFGII